jgi:N-acetylmuramoyl-L-alanine amidase
MSMIEKGRAAWDVMQQGKALSEPGVWSNRAKRGGHLAGLLSALVALLCAFGYRLELSADDIKELAGGISTAVFVVTQFSNLLHIAANPNAGLRAQPVAHDVSGYAVQDALGRGDPHREMSAAVVTLDDIDILARTIWGEAAGDGEIAMRAVAAVVLNRVKAGRYGHGIWGVCLKPHQFGCWTDGSAKAQRLRVIDASDRSFRLALEIAEDALSGRLVDVTGGATHYHQEGARPGWASGMRCTRRIGRRLFYREQ